MTRHGQPAPHQRADAADHCHHHRPEPLPALRRPHWPALTSRKATREGTECPFGRAIDGQLANQDSRPDRRIRCGPRRMRQSHSVTRLTTFLSPERWNQRAPICGRGRRLDGRAPFLDGQGDCPAQTPAWPVLSSVAARPGRADRQDARGNATARHGPGDAGHPPGSAGSSADGRPQSCVSVCSGTTWRPAPTPQPRMSRERCPHDPFGNRSPRCLG